MEIEEAIEILNENAIYFIFDPKTEKPFFEKYPRKKFVKYNYYSGLFANEKEDYTFEEIIEGAQEIETVEIIGKGRITTKNYAFQIVKPINKQAKAFVLKKGELEIRLSKKGVIASLESVPFIHSCAVIKKQLTKRLSPMTEYPNVVQVHFKRSKLNSDLSNKAIESFLFELDNTYNLKFGYDEFNTPLGGGYLDFQDYPKSRDIKTVEKVSKRINKAKWPEYDHIAVKLFTEAHQTLNEEVKLILLYKVFEYFGPIVLKLETHDKLGQRLSDSQVNDPDSKYLSSIVDLVNNYNSKKNDEGMLKEVFKNCLDIEVISDQLPQYILDSKTPKTDLTEFRIRIAQILYSTRNSFVHAKSNYIKKGNECKMDELGQFNIFLSLAAAQVIKWHRKLPKHQK